MTETASILPAFAVKQLTDAAAVDPGAPFGESIPRAFAVHSAIVRVKLQYPQFFVVERFKI